MFTFKKGAAGLMAGISAFGCVVPALAAGNVWDESYTHNQQEGSDSNVDVNVLVQNRTLPMIFSAYVPATVKIAVSRDKQIITPENLRIINGVDTLPIGVWDVKSKPVNGWTILDYDTNFKDKGMTDQKKFAMKLNGSDLKYYANGLPWEIEAAGELPLNLEAKIPYQSAAKDMEEIMTVSFTMDWMDRVAVPDGRAHASGSNINKSTFDANLKGLTGTLRFSRAALPSDELLQGKNQVPLNSDGSVVAVIDGQDATVYSKLGGGVFAPVDSTRLFNGYRATGLDLSGLDLTKTTSFYHIFCGNKFTYLNTYGLNTGHLTNMEYMFHDISAPELDLTTWDLSKVTRTSYMFSGTSVPKIFCRSEADKAKMISSGSRSTPVENFIVGRTDH